MEDIFRELHLYINYGLFSSWVRKHSLKKMDVFIHHNVSSPSSDLFLLSSLTESFVSMSGSCDVHKNVLQQFFISLCFSCVPILVLLSSPDTWRAGIPCVFSLMVVWRKNDMQPSACRIKQWRNSEQLNSICLCFWQAQGVR